MQFEQDAPPGPHAALLCDAKGTQVVPEQHPLGQLVALQAQLLPTQAWPAAQAMPLEPHTHEPLVQALALIPHVAQEPPLWPQSLKVVPARHWLLMPAPALQQPAHLVGSHTQTPPEHNSPAPHIAPLPHLHAPPEQLSARAMSHATQAAPLVPQAANVEDVMQLPLLQQPLGQVVLLHAPHAPLAQGSAPQFWQAAPLTPHVICAEATHWLEPLQQPVQPLVASHTQAFCALQRWPTAHTVPGAQPHVPELQ